MCRKPTRLVGLVALLVAAVLLASPAAAAANGASKEMGVHGVNQCVVIGAVNYCFSAKEVYHAVWHVHRSDQRHVSLLDVGG